MMCEIPCADCHWYKCEDVLTWVEVGGKMVQDYVAMWHCTNYFKQEPAVQDDDDYDYDY